MKKKMVDVVSMIGAIVFYGGGGGGGGMHYWECEEVVTRFKSFACCIERYILLQSS